MAQPQDRSLATNNQGIFPQPARICFKRRAWRLRINLPYGLLRSGHGTPKPLDIDDQSGF